MHRRLLLMVGIFALLGAFVLAPLTKSTAAQSTTNPLQGIPITGTLNGSPFSGVLNVTHFSNQQGQLVATGTITDTAGSVVSTFTAPVAATGTCPILDLTIGPIHLDLLGLVLDTNTIHVQLTAQQGPGNLLGNLLCAVAHLLDSSAPTGALAGLLNQILRLLG